MKIDDLLIESQPTDAPFSDVEIADALKKLSTLPEVKELEDLGYSYDRTSSTQLKRGNITFRGDRIYVVYANGYIRSQTRAGTTGVVERMKPLPKLLDSYQAQLKRLILTVKRGDRLAAKAKERKDQIGDKTAKTLEPYNLPRTYQYDLYLQDYPNLVSLKGAPEVCKKEFYLRNAPSLTSLEGAPRQVNGSFTLSNVPYLHTLHNGPAKVKGYIIENCKSITALDGLPDSIDRFTISHHGQLSLKGIGQKFLRSCNSFSMWSLVKKYGDQKAGTQTVHHPFELTHILGLVFVEGLDKKHAVNIGIPGYPGLNDIIQAHAGRGQGAILDFQHALIDANYDDMAQL